jgi:epoxyqueuosine reductase
VRSIIMLGVNYGPKHDPLAILSCRDRGSISVYAQGDDYHDVIKKRLKSLAQWLISQAGGDVKVFIDTAAVMEKPLAAAGARLAGQAHQPGFAPTRIVALPRDDFHNA